jgi:small GTP-binding protein
MAYKVVMVGIVGVGKKSLMKRFGGAEFSSSEISKMSKHFVSSDVERYMIKTWDDKGREVQEKLIENRRSILPFTKKADILMVVYDITNVLSFKYLPDILEQIISSGTTPWMSLVLVGNKVDLDWKDGARQVSSDMAFDLCRRYGFGLNFETSAKIGTNVTELLSVALSRCEQDRVRELNNSLKTDYAQILDRNLAEQPTFAQNIASFFGIGAGTRSEINRSLGDVDSIGVGAKSDLMSSADDTNTKYSSRFGPASSYSRYAGESDYQIVHRASGSRPYRR